MGLFDFWKKLVDNKQPRKKKRKKAAARKKIIKKPKKKTPRKIPRLPRKHKRTKTHKKHRYKIKIKKLKKRPSQANKKPSKKPKEKEIGIITHYFDKISVGIIKLKADLKLGETIRIKGLNSDFIQTVKSMQLNHKDITKAKKGDEIGAKVIQPVGKNNKVYRVTA